MWNGFAYANSDCNCIGHTNCDGHRNRKCVGNAYSYGTTVTKDYTNSAPASDCSTSAVSVGAETQLSSGTREAIREFPKALLRQSALSERQRETRCPNAFARRRLSPYAPSNGAHSEPPSCAGGFHRDHFVRLGQGSRGKEKPIPSYGHNLITNRFTPK